MVKHEGVNNAAAQCSPHIFSPEICRKILKKNKKISVVHSKT